MDLLKSILPPAKGILPYYMLIVRQIDCHKPPSLPRNR